MLREIHTARQNSKQEYKRWFTDSDMDLFIWFNNGVPMRFQLSYNRRGVERVIHWNEKTGYSHHQVDSYNRQQLHTRHNKPPILPVDGELDAPGVALEFLRASEHINESLADFIYARLLEHPGRIAIRSNQKPVSKYL